MPRDIAGYDPDNDRMLDPQQRDAEIRAVCDCCGHGIYEWEDYYELNVKKDVLIICTDCKEEIREVPA